MTTHVPSTAFKAGTSGNPGGRPASNSQMQLYVRRLGMEAVDTMIDIQRRGTPNDRVRLAAAMAIFEYGFGKARQSIDVNLDVQAKIAALTNGRPLSACSPEEVVMIKQLYIECLRASTAVVEAAVEEVPRAVQLDLIGDAT